MRQRRASTATSSEDAVIHKYAFIPLVALAMSSSGCSSTPNLAKIRTAVRQCEGPMRSMMRATGMANTADIVALAEQAATACDSETGEFPVGSSALAVSCSAYPNLAQELVDATVDASDDRTSGNLQKLGRARADYQREDAGCTHVLGIPQSPRHAHTV
jgi:hypothetical protein